MEYPYPLFPHFVNQTEDGQRRQTIQGYRCIINLHISLSVAYKYIFFSYSLIQELQTGNAHHPKSACGKVLIVPHKWIYVLQFATGNTSPYCITLDLMWYIYVTWPHLYKHLSLWSFNRSSVIMKTVRQKPILEPL